MASEKTASEPMMPLALLAPGEKGLIAHMRSCSRPDAEYRGAEGTQRLEELGLRVGKSVEILSSGAGPILLNVDESRIALARGLAMKIMVRRQ